jgi:predicted HTH transcriptional regulator
MLSEQMKLVKTGPGLAEKLEHEKLVKRLREFRKSLEADMAPEPLAALTVSAVVLLSDVCAALGLDENRTAQVLGAEGMATLACEVAIMQKTINHRQIAALACTREHGRIRLSEFRAICPHWSDETLRLDLVDLVKRGMLSKKGNKRGAHYILAK